MDMRAELVPAPRPARTLLWSTRDPAEARHMLASFTWCFGVRHLSNNRSKKLDPTARCTQRQKQTTAPAKVAKVPKPNANERKSRCCFPRKEPWTKTTEKQPCGNPHSNRSSELADFAQLRQGTVFSRSIATLSLCFGDARTASGSRCLHLARVLTR